MAIVDLSALKWTLEGWRPFNWKLGKSVETNWGFQPDVGPFYASVPGTVQQALRDAGVLPDWHVGVNSRLCEWVEHRHWFFSATLPAGSVEEGQRVRLAAEGLDYAGWLVVDGKEAGRFEGALIPHRFELTGILSDGNEHRLGIVFEEPPREQGQIGYTSRSRYFKPRYNYSWDWCPRFVPVGVWDSIYLETGPSHAFHLSRVRATLDAGNRTGWLGCVVEADTCEHQPLHVVATLMDDAEGPGREVAQTSASLEQGSCHLTLANVPVEPWWPNGEGKARLYRIEVRVECDGACVWSESRTVGFKRVEWEPCEGASADAEPWLCVVNDKRIFLQGANWVPPRAGFADTTFEEYQRLIALYRDMGCNVLRVWGGGILEKEAFYDLCDQAGILVWQEFPLSSSGVDNCPPDDLAVIDRLVSIASTYVQRRAHHVSLLLWCGGNELFGTPGQSGGSNDRPVQAGHPCIAALKDMVECEDPGRRFLAGSPSGARIWGQAEEWGKGVHHDVHGPWGMTPNQTLNEWRAYWEGDDALFRSEVGMPGAMDVDLIRHYSGGMQAWPPEGEYWRHTAAWWTQRERFTEALASLDEKTALAEYVRMTQELQAEAYRIAATCCRQRFPRCGGFIIWMGHDCYPCPANNSVIDFLRNPKPAYFALKEVFRDR